ncbi:MAG: RNA methyltransferase, partial [Polaribacter sp.]|nr:RNA methyltransferase [Polaribacter sp.]
LEDTFQPHNTSAVMRTCDIFGIQDLYTVENQFASKVSKHIARGSQKWVTRNRYKGDFNNNLQLCFDDLRKDGYQIIATSPHIDSCYLSDFEIDKKTAFVFGKEKEGISDFTKNNVDGFLKIPMYGFTESFNISVAVAIILENLTSKLRKSTIEWQLTDREKHELYTLWVQKASKMLLQL